MLWEKVKQKLSKSGRKYAEVHRTMPYREAELFCEECGKSLGVFDIVTTDLDSNKFCTECVQKYIKATPIKIDCGTIISDFGNFVVIKYNNYCCEYHFPKTCYFNKKGRYIKKNGKRYYL